jgi:hypothetical protein
MRDWNRKESADPLNPYEPFFENESPWDDFCHDCGDYWPNPDLCPCFWEYDGTPTYLNSDVRHWLGGTDLQENDYEDPRYEDEEMRVVRWKFFRDAVGRALQPSSASFHMVGEETTAWGELTHEDCPCPVCTHPDVPHGSWYEDALVDLVG